MMDARQINDALDSIFHDEEARMVFRRNSVSK